MRQHLHLPQQSLAYLTAGDPSAPPLILLHGMGVTADIWSENISVLAEHHYVLAPDLPGHGASAKPWRPYTFAYVTGLLRDFAVALHLPPAVICGNSFGGTLALAYALAAPQHVDALILVAPFIAERWPLTRAHFTELLFPALRIGLIAPTLADFHRAADFVLFSRDHLPPAWRFEAAYWQDLLPGFIWGGLGATLELGLPSQRRRFLRRAATLAQPALLAWGADDRLFPPHGLDDLAAALPHATIHTYARCGHNPPLEHPHQFNRDVLAFLKTIQPLRQPQP